MTEPLAGSHEQYVNRNVEQCAIGSETPSSVKDLYRNHSQFVWRRLQQMSVQSSDLEDGLQEVFVVAFRNWAQFDPNRAKATTWLFGICHNVARNLARGERRREAHIDRSAEPCAEPGPDSPEEALRRRQTAQMLEQLLATLPNVHRTTLLLCGVAGMKGREIAEQMQVPEGTVRSRLQHARQHIETAVKTQLGALPSQRATASYRTNRVAAVAFA